MLHLCSVKLVNTWVTFLCGVAGVLNTCATLVLYEAGYLCIMKLVTCVL